jgi:hypothetical protein
VNETARKRSARRARIIGDVYAAWVAEHVANGTLRAALVGEANCEENAELAPSFPPMPMPSYSAGRLRLFEQRVCDCDGNRSMRFSCLGSIEGCPTLGDRRRNDACRPPARIEACECVQVRGWDLRVSHGGSPSVTGTRA